jgi:hypothetical protein
VDDLGNGKLDLIRVNEAGTDITKEMIEYGKDHMYILDCQTEVYVWESIKASKAYRLFVKEKLKV